MEDAGRRDPRAASRRLRSGSPPSRVCGEPSLLFGRVSVALRPVVVRRELAGGYRASLPRPNGVATMLALPSPASAPIWNRLHCEPLRRQHLSCVAASSKSFPAMLCARASAPADGRRSKKPVRRQCSPSSPPSWVLRLDCLQRMRLDFFVRAVMATATMNSDRRAAESRRAPISTAGTASDLKAFLQAQGQIQAQAEGSSVSLPQQRAESRAPAPPLSPRQPSDRLTVVNLERQRMGIVLPAPPRVALRCVRSSSSES